MTNKPKWGTKAYFAEFRKSHREYLTEYKRQWNSKNANRLNKKERERYWSDPGIARSKRRMWHQRLRLSTIDLLGSKCAICGFDDWRALQIDHVNGGGTRERKLLSHTPTSLLKHVIKSIEEGELKYQLLCANCNWIKRFEKKEQYRK